MGDDLGGLSWKRPVTWSYLLDQPKTKATALFMMGLGLVSVFNGIPGIGHMISTSLAAHQTYVDVNNLVEAFENNLQGAMAKKAAVSGVRLVMAAGRSAPLLEGMGQIMNAGDAIYRASFLGDDPLKATAITLPAFSSAQKASEAVNVALGVSGDSNWREATRAVVRERTEAEFTDKYPTAGQIGFESAQSDADKFRRVSFPGEHNWDEERAGVTPGFIPG